LLTKFDEKIRMKSAQIQFDENAAKSGTRKLPVEWSEGEGFCLNAWNEVSLKQSHPGKDQRHRYVKLVIDLPDYRAARSPVPVRGDRRNGGMGCPGIVRDLPQLIFLRRSFSVAEVSQPEPMNHGNRYE